MKRRKAPSLLDHYLDFKEGIRAVRGGLEGARDVQAGIRKALDRPPSERPPTPEEALDALEETVDDLIAGTLPGVGKILGATGRKGE